MNLPDESDVRAAWTPSPETVERARVTEFTHWLARERGLSTADGLGMLLHQAVRGFHLWFGRRPEVTAELRALVEADLAAS